MSKIYVVTRGVYSDYHVLMASTNKEEVEKYVSQYNSLLETNAFVNDYRLYIEEYEDLLPELKPFFTVEFDYTTLEVEDVEFHEQDIEDLILYSDTISVTVRADSPEDAVKIASEKAAIAKYEREKGSVL